VKDYLIWLYSGQIIDGTMEDDEAERLRITYRNRLPGIQEFTDTEGVVLLEIKDVSALGINKAISSKKAGFNKTDTP